MQIESTCDNGRLEFSRPVTFKHKRFNLLVTLPDEEIAGVENSLIVDLPAAVLALAEETRKRLDDVMAEPIRADDELPEPSAKAGERVEAFELRKDR